MREGECVCVCVCVCERERERERERGKEKKGDEVKRAICTKASRKASKHDSKGTRMFCLTLNSRMKPHKIRFILSVDKISA
jgi:hypothetical protein